jgi:hypothetical protein
MPPAARHLPALNVEGVKPKRQRLKRYPIGFFHMDIAKVQTAKGKLNLFVGMTAPASLLSHKVDKANR